MAEADNCTHDCSSCGANCPSRNPQSMIAKPHEGSKIKKVIGVVSGKGGVGKSLVTELLASGFNKAGFKTGIIDADITGPSIPKAFGVTEKAGGTPDTILPVKTKTGIDIMSINVLLEDENAPVVWRGPIIAGAVKQFWTDVLWEDIDYMFVDMPPGTGDVPLTVFQSLPIDGIVVVATPQDLVSMIVKKAVKMAEMMNVPILGLVENMSYVKCPDCGKPIYLFGESHVAEIAMEYGLILLLKLPVDPKISQAVDAGDIENIEVDGIEEAVKIIVNATND